MTEGTSLTVVVMSDIIQGATCVCRIVKSNDAPERSTKHAKAKGRRKPGEH